MFSARLLYGILAYNLGLASFLSGLFSEDFLFILMIIAPKNFSSILSLTLLGGLGMIIQGAIYYLCGQYINFKKIKKFFRIKEKNEKIVTSINKFDHNNYLLTLFLSKFVLGTRVITYLYIGHHEKKFWRFMLWNILSTILWLVIVLPVAWIANEGLMRFFRWFRGFERVLLIILLVFLSIFFIRNWIYNRLNKSKKK